MKRSRSEFALHHVDPDLESNMLPEFLEAKDRSQFSQASRKSRTTVQGALDIEKRCDHETKGGLTCNKGVFAGVFVADSCLRFCKVHFYRAVAKLMEELASGLVLTSSRGELRCFLSKVTVNNSMALTPGYGQTWNARLGDETRNVSLRSFVPELGPLREITATWIIERSEDWPPMNDEHTPEERWDWFVANFGDPSDEPGVLAHFRVTTMANGFELQRGTPFEFGMAQEFEAISNELTARFRVDV